MGKLLPVRNESIDPKLHISACHLHHKASVMAFPADSNLYWEETQICLDEFMLPEQMFFPSSKWSCQGSLLHHVNLNYYEWYHSVFFHFYIKGSYIRNVVEDSIIIKKSNQSASIHFCSLQCQYIYHQFWIILAVSILAILTSSLFSFLRI